MSPVDMLGRLLVAVATSVALILLAVLVCDWGDDE